MSKAPAFQFYAQDFLTGCTYLTNEEVGMYIKMLCKQWTDGSIPLRRLEFLIQKKWEDLSEDLKGKFVLENEILRNKRLEIERQKQIEKSEKAKVSADARWNKNPEILSNKEKNKSMRTHNKRISENDAFLEDRSLNNEIENEIEIKEENEKKVKTDFSKIVQDFNSVCTELAKVQNLSKQRESSINSIIKKYGSEKLAEAFYMVSKSSFLNGHNEKQWRATFDWILNPNNFIKIIDGNYVDKNPVQNNSFSGTSKRQADFNPERIIKKHMERRQFNFSTEEAINNMKIFETPNTTAPEPIDITNFQNKD